MKAKFIVFRHLFKNIYSFVFSMFFMFFRLLMVCCLFFSQEALAFTNDGPEPPHTMNGTQISITVGKDILDYINYRVIGSCLWLYCDFPLCKVTPTLELDEYLPDLIVSVYNGRGNDPFYEMSKVPVPPLMKSADDLGYESGNLAFNKVANTDIPIGNGNSNTLMSKGHYDAMRTKSVDVIGSPLAWFHIPFLMLRADTSPYTPYYISDTDVLGRLGIAEALRPEIWDPFHYYIGSSSINYWSYEFPRSMTVNVYNDYKASVVSAERAADIVTNQNTLHTNISTSNSCGDNCVVSNVIEDPNEDHEIWQEVYPNDEHIHPGENDAATISSIGSDDEQAGNGNYIFVVWRRYQGCIQSDGDLIYKSQTFDSTPRR